jgi:hypothetical protein
MRLVYEALNYQFEVLVYETEEDDSCRCCVVETEVAG